MFSNQAVLSACLITQLGLVSTRLKLRRREQSNLSTSLQESVQVPVQSADNIGAIILRVAYQQSV